MDISQFIATFFVEAQEKLDELEQGLLALEPREATDPETVNDIFRAAHTIKGGAGSFGFTAIAEFTHLMETLLDQVRDGRRAVSDELVESLLEAKDCLCDLVAAAKAEAEPDNDLRAAVEARLQALLDDGAVAPAAAGEPAVSQTAPRGWRILFEPFPQLMHSGNDPVRLLRELAELGELEVQADSTRLPEWSDLEPEDCYLGWEITLRGAIPREQVDDVFLWVEGECDLTLLPLEESPTPGEEARAQPEKALTPADPVEVIVEQRKQPERRQQPRRRSDKGDATSIRVDIGKIDNVINQVGELITTQSILSNLRERFDPDNVALMHQLGDHLDEAVDLLERHTRDLQEHVMSMRMLPISFVFSRFGRTVHDLCAKLGKQVELHLAGENTELDKTVIEQIGDPMMHLIRNAMDHGFETPEERAAAGKPATGVLMLNAYHKGGNVYIEVCDDGRGLDRDKLISKAVEKGLIDPERGEQMSDEEAYRLILHAGFSTAAQLSDLSGRGVGMDVVRQNIESLNGELMIASEKGVGTTLTIRLPLTLAIMDGQLISVGQDTFVVPVVSIVQSLQVDPAMIRRVAGKGELLRYRDDYLPILRLHQAFGLESQTHALEEGVVVVLDVDGRRLAVFVDSIFGQQQVAIKSLESNFQRVQGIMGATILGDGSIALILDPPGLSRLNAISTH